ncbi:MAG: YfhO family protein [Candidatus Daviesbacteria bacterium]|nr:YfhO family protein [Candidatus Daviesbacteria bacterium]
MNIKEAIIAAIFFLFITLLFFYKIFFGLIPLPTDLIVGAYYPWMNYKWGGFSVGVPIQNSKLSDAVSLYYPFKSLAADFEKKGQLPLWNPYMFGGYPLFANVQAGLLFPTMIFYLLFSAPIAWTIQVISQPLLASFFMYLLLRHFKLAKLPSIFGSVVYGFGGSTILWIEWNTQATTSLFLPILILLEDKFLNSRSLKWGGLLSIFICLQIFAGYLPVIPFTFICMGLWFLFRSKRLLSDLQILLFVILGLSLSAIFLLPVTELIRISQRTVEFLSESSPFLAPENLINLIAPDFYGNPATGNFWGKGDNMDSTIYAGATALIFALLGLKKYFGKTEVKFALCLFILALVISLPNPLSVFLYNLGLWGGPSLTMNRINFLPNFSLAILGAYGLSIIKNNTKLSLKPSIWILSIILGAGTGLFLSQQLLLKTLDSIKFFINPTNLVNDIVISLVHINIGFKNLILPVFIVIFVSLLIIISNYFRRIRLIVPAVFVIILIFELFRFGLKFNSFSSPDFLYPKTSISEYLKRFPNDRFIAEKDIFPANMWLPYKISSIQGYDGIYPLNIAQLLAVSDSDNINAAPKPRWGLVGNFNSKILDESNTRFLLAVKRGEEGRARSNGAVSVTISPKYKEVFEDSGIAILENSQSLPRVYVTKKVIRASDKETLRLMLDDSFPIKTTSISDFEWNNDSAEGLQNNLIYEQVTNSYIKIKTTSNADSYLVVLDSFYPGWKATIDGKDTTIHKTNYNFRGILLPKGSHIVEFKYFPESLKYGTIISGVSLIIIILLLFSNLFYENIKKK